MFSKGLFSKVVSQSPVITEDIFFELWYLNVHTKFADNEVDLTQGKGHWNDRKPYGRSKILAKKIFRNVVSTLYFIDSHFNASTIDSFWKRNKQFLLFPQCFLLNQKILSLFFNIFYIIPLFAVELEEPEIGMWGKRLNPSKLQ